MATNSKNTSAPAAQNPFDEDDGEERSARGASAGADERSTRPSAPEVRGEPGVHEDVQRAENALSDEEFASLLDSGFDDNRLPSVPKIPGFHCCWLSSSNPYDTIAKRQRLGYVPVRNAEVPGMMSLEPGVQKDDAVVTCHEMVLHKIADRRYQALMTHYHHAKPLADERGALERIKAGNDRDSGGKTLGSQEGDGIETLERSVRAGARAPTPRF